MALNPGTIGSRRYSAQKSKSISDRDKWFFVGRKNQIVHTVSVGDLGGGFLIVGAPHSGQVARPVSLIVPTEQKAAPQL